MTSASLRKKSNEDSAWKAEGLLVVSSVTTNMVLVTPDTGSQLTDRQSVTIFCGCKLAILLLLLYSTLIRFQWQENESVVLQFIVLIAKASALFM